LNISSSEQNVDVNRLRSAKRCNSLKLIPVRSIISNSQSLSSTGELLPLHLIDRLSAELKDLLKIGDEEEEESDWSRSTEKGDILIVGMGLGDDIF
jgi:hypothetical protein